MLKTVYLMLILSYWVSVSAQSEQKQFWALNGSPAALIWDNTLSNNQIDNGSGTWDNSTRNWTFNTGITDLIWRPFATAIFGGNPGVAAAGTVTVSGTQIAQSLLFNPVASGNFTISGGTITNNSGNIIANTSATISSVLAGTNGLTLTGTGTITLGGTNTYTGTTTVSSGTLLLANGTSTAYTPTLSTPVIISPGATLSANIATLGINISGNISGGGTLNISGAGTQTLRLFGTNSGFTGNFSEPSGSRGIMWSDNQGTGNAANTGSAAASWDLSGLFGFIETNAAATPVVQLGALSGSNSATSIGGFGGSGIKTFQIGALNTNTTYAGSVQNNPQTTGTPVIALTKVGTGTLTLTSTANTYTGLTTVNAGTLAFPNAIPSSTTWNIAVNATTAPTAASSGLMTIPASLTLLGRTINIILTGTSTGFTWNAVSWSGLMIAAPALQINGTAVISGIASGGTTVTVNLASGITVKR